MTDNEKIKQMIMQQKVANKASKFIKMKQRRKDKGQENKKQKKKTNKYQIQNNK